MSWDRCPHLRLTPGLHCWTHRTRPRPRGRRQELLSFHVAVQGAPRRLVCEMGPLQALQPRRALARSPAGARVCSAWHLHRHPDCVTVVLVTWLGPEVGEGGLGGPGELEATPQSQLLDSRAVAETGTSLGISGWGQACPCPAPALTA